MPLMRHSLIKIRDDIQAKLIEKGHAPKGVMLKKGHSYVIRDYKLKEEIYYLSRSYDDDRLYEVEGVNLEMAVIGRNSLSDLEMREYLEGIGLKIPKKYFMAG